MIFSFASSSSPGPHRELGVPDEQEVFSDGEEVREEISATLATLMPWGVSILVHMALIVLAFFLVWQTIVPAGEQDTVPTLSRVPDVSAPSKESSLEPASSSASAMLVVPTVVPTVMSPKVVKPVMPGFNLQTVATIQTPQHQNAPFCCPGTGVGKKNGPFEVGDEDGDKNSKGGSSKVVFVVDASGSMVDVLPFVVNELKRVVNAELGQENEATVLFFSGHGVFEIPGQSGLRPVTAQFKERFHAWVSLDNHQYQTGGRGSLFVRQALTRALGYQPEVVYLLSDNLTGGGQGATQHELFQDELLDLVRAKNDSNSPARISTVQFLYEDPLVRAGLTGTLQRIADETGGNYRFVSQSELKLR